MMRPSMRSAGESADQAGTIARKYVRSEPHNNNKPRTARSGRKNNHHFLHLLIIEHNGIEAKSAGFWR